MTGVAARFEIEGLVNLGLALGRLSDLDFSDLADKASAYLISSTRDRITNEQASPEGAPWSPWSEPRSHPARQPVAPGERRGPAGLA